MAIVIPFNIKKTHLSFTELLTFHLRQEYGWQEHWRLAFITFSCPYFLAYFLEAIVIPFNIKKNSILIHRFTDIPSQARIWMARTFETRFHNIFLPLFSCLFLRGDRHTLQYQKKLNSHSQIYRHSISGKNMDDKKIRGSLTRNFLAPIFLLTS